MLQMWETCFKFVICRKTTSITLQYNQIQKLTFFHIFLHTGKSRNIARVSFYLAS